MNFIKKRLFSDSNKGDKGDPGSVNSVTGDFVNNTDPTNPVINRGYKVYTANITEQESVATSGTLTIGVLYLIEQLQDGDDFSNVGYVTDGTPFEATGTTPTIWDNSTQVWDVVASTPAAVVCDNTIGTITFTYIGQGSYQINSDGLFIGNVWLGQPSSDSTSIILGIALLNPDIINLDCYQPKSSTNNLNGTTSLEIRLYP